MREYIIKNIKNSILVKEKLLTDEKCLKAVEDTCKVILNCYKKGGTVYVMGNGGSASDAQHMTGELVGRFLKERRPLSAISLSTDTSILTAISNDFGYDCIFEKQIEAHAKKEDVVIGISTSGNSKNVIKAIEKANEIGATTIGLLGKDGGILKNITNIPIVIETKDTPHVQESHITLIHIICGIVEDNL